MIVFVLKFRVTANQATVRRSSLTKNILRKAGIKYLVAHKLFLADQTQRKTHT